MNIASLFRGKKAEPVDAIAEAKAHADSCKATLESAVEDQRRARDRLDVAEARVRAALAKRDQALLDGGDLTLVTQVIAGAQREVESAREALINADRSVEVATAAAVRAGEEFSAAKRAKKVAELRERASIATLNARIEAPAMRIIELREQMLECAAEMDRAILSSHEATAELRELGEPALPLPVYHLVMPFIRHAIAETPERARKLLGMLGSEIYGLMYAFSPGTKWRIGETVQNVIVPKDDLIGRILNAPIWEATPEVHQKVTEDLHAIFEGGFEARDALHKKRQQEHQRVLQAEGGVPNGWFAGSHGARHRYDIIDR